jgi:hypothetical protein
MANASTAPAYATTTTNTTITTPHCDDDGDGGFEAVDEGEMRDTVRPKSSDKDEPSVLFSEQVGLKTEPTEAVPELDEGEFFVEHISPEDTSPCDMVDEVGDEEELAEEEDQVAPAPINRSRSSSISSSDPDGDIHYHNWTRRWAFDKRLSSSDGIEPLSEWTRDIWKEDENLLETERLDHFRRYTRKVARGRKQRQIGWTDSELDYSAPPKNSRMTRELFEDRLGYGEPAHLISYHSGDTDDFCMDHRPALDKAGIKRDIKKFTDSIDALSDRAGNKRDYQVVDRLGEGRLSRSISSALLII